MAYMDSWMTDEEKRKRRKGPTVTNKGDVMAGPGDYIFPGETQFPKIKPTTDKATGVRHMPADPKDITHLIRGTTQSWMHPSGLQYKDPMAAQFGGPDYLPHKTLPGGATSLGAARIKGTLTEKETAALTKQQQALIDYAIKGMDQPTDTAVPTGGLLGTTVPGVDEEGEEEIVSSPDAPLMSEEEMDRVYRLARGLPPPRKKKAWDIWRDIDF